MKRFVCFHEQNSIFNAWGYCLDTQLINGSTNIVMLTEPESSAIHIVGFLCGIQLKETFNALLCFPFPSVCHKGSCACKKKKKLERSEHQQKLPQKTPLLNTSSIVPSLKLWFCDITLHHHVAHLQLFWLVRIDSVGSGMCESTNQSRERSNCQTKWTVWKNGCVLFEQCLLWNYIT